MNLAALVPVADGKEQKEFTNKCLASLKETMSKPNIHLLKGSDGVLPTFKRGLDIDADILCFLHNDVLIHEKGWDDRVINAFKDDPKLGLVGILGARGVAPDGGRIGVMSHMIGKEYGKCDCHDPIALHHGELMMDTSPAVVLDGVGLFFRKEALLEVASKTNIFADDRPPHHWYDRNICLNFIEQGWHLAVVGIQFDHFSGATANHSKTYHDFAKGWLNDRGYEAPEDNADLGVYKVGEKQFLKEWGGRLPAFVSQTYEVTWRF